MFEAVLRQMRVPTAFLLPLLIGLPAAAQQEASICRAGTLSQGTTLGITGLACTNCAVETQSDGRRVWQFDTEPEVMNVAEDGPAHGILEPRDIIVAIDGNPITTSTAGARWGALQPGELVALRIRRGDRLIDVAVRASVRCAPVEAPPAPTPRDREAERRLMPPGWIGAGLSCYCAVNATGVGSGMLDGAPLWTFREPPVVEQLVENGPAVVAGLRVGDRLISIDGVRFDTTEGGRRFSRMTPGTAVRLVVERDGQRTDIVITPMAPPGRS